MQVIFMALQDSNWSAGTSGKEMHQVNQVLRMLTHTED